MRYGIIGMQLVMVIACLNIAGCGLMVDQGAEEHELESFVMIRNLGEESISNIAIGVISRSHQEAVNMREWMELTGVVSASSDRILVPGDGGRGDTLIVRHDNGGPCFLEVTEFGIEDDETVERSRWILEGQMWKVMDLNKE